MCRKSGDKLQIKKKIFVVFNLLVIYYKYWCVISTAGRYVEALVVYFHQLSMILVVYFGRTLCSSVSCSYVLDLFFNVF